MISRTVLVVAIIILLGASGVGLFSLLETQAALNEAAARETQISTKLTSVETDNQALVEALDSERRQKEELEEELDDLDEKYDDLRKLQRTDSELLAKYSKVYFLSENYVPTSLIEIPQPYVSDAEKETFLRAAWKYLRDMVDDAKEDDVDITIVSGYRSFETQTALKSGYKVTYGYGANAFSADQGYSEHQLGTAVDFSTKATGGALDGFQNTPAFAWLAENAHTYGFILSYPAGNAYYQYEPWHWRFVGKELADDLTDDGNAFYSLDQRDLDKYLITLFD